MPPCGRLGHAEPSDDARELFRRCGPIWLTFAAAHAVAAARGRPEDWWALAWLRGTEVLTDVVWSRSPAFRDTRTRATLVGAGVANLAMAAGFGWLARRSAAGGRGDPAHRGHGHGGLALLRRLVAAGTPVRCLVREPKRLGAERVRVQIALGDLADPASFRNALRGVDTVVHLAASTRDQPRGSIEELNAMATHRLVRAAERSSARSFVFFSASARACSPPRASFAPRRSRGGRWSPPTSSTTVFSASIIYAPGDPWLKLLERFSYLPAIPVAGSGESVFQPIWADDAADCVHGGAGPRRRRRSA